MRLSAVLALVGVVAPFIAEAQTCSSLYGQCGGKEWKGTSCCVDGATCHAYSDYYSQCVPGTDAPTTKPAATTATPAPTTATPAPTTATPKPTTTSTTPAPTTAAPTTPTATTAGPVTTATPSGGLHPAFPIKYCTASGCTSKATQIVLDGKDFPNIAANNYTANGVSISGSTMKLTMTGGQGPRVYLVSPNDNKYEMLHLIGKEFTYDVEESELACNMNGALYTVGMAETGAATGAGYCDANGVGGSYCPEFDIWEANKYSNAFTTHADAHDNAGCPYNNYKFGYKDLYGPGASYSVDTTKKFSVVTQFFASGGAMNEIRRLYIQNGKVIQGGRMTLFKCDVEAMGQAMADGHVLAMSLWQGSMWWLDTGKNGPCPTGTDGMDATVTFSDIRIGDIGTTAAGTDAPAPAGNTTVVPANAQCGGAEYDGSNICEAGTTCNKMSMYYWQCS